MFSKNGKQIHIETQWKGNTFFSHLPITKCEAEGYLASSLLSENVCYIWTDKKRYTTNIDSKKTKTNKCKRLKLVHFHLTEISWELQLMPLIPFYGHTKFGNCTLIKFYNSIFYFVEKLIKPRGLTGYNQLEGSLLPGPGLGSPALLWHSLPSPSFISGSPPPPVSLGTPPSHHSFQRRPPKCEL